MTCRGTTADATRAMRRPRLMVVGAGTHFLSAMSYYTLRLTNALAQHYDVVFVPMRGLIPKFLYPGRAHVGTVTTRLQYEPSVRVMRGIDWYWFPNLVRAIGDMVRQPPEVVVFEWWTGSVLHTYLVLGIVARVLGAAVIVEFHEVLDSGEARVPFVRAWVSLLGRAFFRLAAGFVIHSESDRGPVDARYRMRARPCIVIPHGPLDHHAPNSSRLADQAVTARHAPEDSTNLLFFGLIRPYKGLEDLVRAFGLLEPDEADHYWLTVVGETWEGWDLPTRLIATNRYRDRITLINRFVSDEEVVSHFVAADAVVLPYHRSSASSPAQVAMSNGLPLVVTTVGGLPEAVADYEGAILIPPHDPVALRDAIRRLPSLRGQRYRDPHSWDRTVDGYRELMSQLGRH